MSDQLEPYSDWLGIAPHEQPPNYYRLLELAPYESDPGRINASARRQLQRLSPHLGGAHRELAEGLANEITAAGRCLLNAKAKQEYDTQLLAAGIGPEPAAAVPPPGARPVLPPDIEEPTRSQSSAASPSETAPPVEIKTDPVVASRATQSPVRRRLAQRLRVQFIGHLLVPIVSLGIAWAIIKMVRPDFDPVTFFTASQADRQQEWSEQELSQQTRPVPSPRVPRRPQSIEEQETSESDVDRDPDPDTDPAPGSEPNPQDPRPLLEPIAEPQNANSVAFLPDAIDLPPSDMSEWTTVAEQSPPIGSRCRLLLISDRLGDETEHRLGLARATSSSGAAIWTVQPQPQPQPLAAVADETEQPELPLAEFSWEEGRLHFQWKHAGDDRLRSALRNSLLNIRIDNEEKLVQLRRPIKIPSLMLDLSKSSLQMPLDIPHLPPLEKLRLQITDVDFQGLEHRLDEEQREGIVGQKLSTFVTTPPGVRFQIWLESVGNGLFVRTEGHYRLGSTAPAPLTKEHVERRMKGFMRRGRAARGLVALEAVAKLGDVIHGQAPFQYRVFFTFEFDDIAMEVVLLEAAGREDTDPANMESSFSGNSLADTHSREPVPSEADRKAARENLAEEYKASYEEANDRASRRRLAATLLERANDASDDLPRQYEMFRLAWVILIQAGDLKGALEVGDQIEQRFEVDRVALRAAIVRAAASASSFSERGSRVIEEILGVSDDAVLSEDHDLAMELVGLAASLHEKTQNGRQAQEIEQRVAFLEAEQRLADEEAYLRSHPDDTEAHLRTGQLALSQGRPWDDCLTILSKGGDDPLAEAARSDLETSEDPVDRAALGDRWYELASTEDALRLRLEERAAMWYSEALPHLQGFSKTRVEARLESLEDQAAEVDPVALDLDGKDTARLAPLTIPLAAEIHRFANGTTQADRREYWIDGDGKRGVLHLRFASSSLHWKRKPATVDLHFYVPGISTAETKDLIEVMHSGKVVGSVSARANGRWYQVSIDPSQLESGPAIDLQLGVRGGDAAAIGGRISGNGPFLKLIFDDESP